MFTDYLGNWTADDTRKIDDIYRKMANGETLETDETKLLVRWEVAQALEEESYKARLQIMQEKAQEDLRQSQEAHEKSMELLNLECEKAKVRLEMVINGQA